MPGHGHGDGTERPQNPTIRLVSGPVGPALEVPNGPPIQLLNLEKRITQRAFEYPGTVTVVDNHFPGLPRAIIRITDDSALDIEVHVAIRVENGPPPDQVLIQLHDDISWHLEAQLGLPFALDVHAHMVTGPDLSSRHLIRRAGSLD
jgi:hypothetical protein